MIERRALLSLVAVLVPLTLGQSVFAQTSSAPASAAAPAAPSTAALPSAPGSTAAPNENQTDARALAETLFFTGRGLLEGGRVAQACQKFAESYRLDPAAGTLLNLGVCHEKEGKVASAWGEFRQALADARRMQRPEREQLAKEAIARLEPDLPFVTIVVPDSVKVQGLQVARNGSPLLEAAWNTELPIDPGQNEVEITAPLYKPEKKTFAIEKRQHVTVTVDALELAPVDRPPPPYWTGKREAGATIFGLGVAAAAVGTVFGVLALNQKSTSDADCPSRDGQLRCSQAGADAMSSAKTDAWVADFGIGVGAAAILVGGYLFATGGVKDEEMGPAPAGPKAEEKAAWGFRFDGGPHGAQGFLTRSF